MLFFSVSLEFYVEIIGIEISVVEIFSEKCTSRTQTSLGWKYKRVLHCEITSLKIKGILSGQGLRSIDCVMLACLSLSNVEVELLIINCNMYLIRQCIISWLNFLSWEIIIKLLQYNRLILYASSTIYNNYSY